MSPEADLRAKRKDGSEYVVKKLWSHRKDEDGTLYFKMTNADCEDPTWELKDCIPGELISRYYRLLRRRETRLAATGTPQS